MVVQCVGSGASDGRGVTEGDGIGVQHQLPRLLLPAVCWLLALRLAVGPICKTGGNRNP